MRLRAKSAFVTALFVVGLQTFADVEYASAIAPIIVTKCAICHYRDGIGPFPLLRYEDVIARKGMVREVVADKRMPPWNADPDVGHFKNDRRLTDQEIKTITTWIDDGAPRGKMSGPVELQRFPSQWSIGPPDAEYILPEVTGIPADGIVPVKTFEVRSGFSRDTWIKAIEIRPGNPKVVHHITISLKTAEVTATDTPFTLDSQLVGRYASGTTAMTFGSGQMMLIPKNALFVVRVHYMTCGKTESDRSRFGFAIGSNPPAGPVQWAALLAPDFVIPPNVRAHRVEASGVVPADVLVHALNVDMHYRGRSFELVSHYPSGRSESLLRISQFDFDWLSDYVLEKPVFLPRGTRLEAIGLFDNSSNNPANPAPNISVRSGPEATHESLQTGLLISTVNDRADIAPESISNPAELAPVK